MQLSHIAYMRHNGNVKLAAEQAHGDELTDTPYPERIHLYKPCTLRLQIILEHNAVRYVLAKRQFSGSNVSRQGLVSQYIVGMGRLLDPVRVHVLQLAAYAKSLGQIPLLI